MIIEWRSRVCALVVCLLLSVFTQTPLFADEFPSREIEILTNAASGIESDIITNIVGLRAGRVLGAQIAVTNLRGDSSARVIEQLAERPADGYSVFLLTTGQFLTLASGKTSISLDTIRPLVRASNDPLVIVANCTEFPDAGELLKAQQSRRLRYGVTWDFPLGGIATDSLAKLANSKHPEMVWLDGFEYFRERFEQGGIDAAALKLSTIASDLLGDDICPLLALSGERLAQVPEVVTAVELGIPLELSSIRGFVVHADTPHDIFELLESAFFESMDNLLYKRFLEIHGLESTSVSASEEWGLQIATQRDMIRQSFNIAESDIQ